MAVRRPKEETLAGAFARLKRESREAKADEARADYDASKWSIYRRNRTGYLAMGSSADWHYRIQLQYLRMMEQARDMARNDAVIGQAIDRAVNNTIQEGFGIDVQTGDDGLNKELFDRWNDWASDPDQADQAKERSFHDMEHDVLRQTMVDGDIMGLLKPTGAIELVEGHRCRTPQRTRRNVIHGVMMDDNRERIEYWFTKNDVDPLHIIKLVSEIDRYPVRDAQGFRQVVHIFDPKRVSQTRGVTALAPVFDVAGMWEDINFAKIVQQQAVSCFAIIRTPGMNQDTMPSVDQQYGAQQSSQRFDGSTRISEAITPGMQIKADQGEKIEGFSPGIPNAEFFDHAKLMLTLVGINLGMPLVMLLMDASETNFSGFRGAVDEARKGFRRNQRWLIERFHKPVYVWKVRQWMFDDPAIAKAAKRQGIDVYGHRWQCPSWAYIEPLKDASADLLRIRNGLTSQRRLHRERGRDWDQLSTEIVEDNALAIRKAKLAAQQINEEINDGRPVHWREVLSTPTPDGLTITMAPESAEPQAAGSMTNG